MTTRQYLAQVDKITAICMRTHTHCCQKGCHHCCSEPLYVDEREADLMLECLDPSLEKDVTVATARWLSKAMPLLNTDMPDAMVWRRTENPCPFLIEGLCSVYDVRPMSCRTFFAIGDPEKCKMPDREKQLYACYPPQATAAMMSEFVKQEERVVMDHLGVFLAEKLLGMKVQSATRMDEATANAQF